MKKELLLKSGLIICLSLFLLSVAGQVRIEQNSDAHTIRIQDKKGNLVLNVNYNNKCVIDYAEVLGNAVITNKDGVFSSVKSNDKWFTTSSDIPSPKVVNEGEKIIINDIIFGDENNRVREKWIFQTFPDYIDWTIERTYIVNMSLEDTGFPQWSFDKMDTWTGALLGTGGVAWCKFFDETNASLGNHTGKVTFWNQKNKSCLSIDPVELNGLHPAIRFSRQPDNTFTLNYTASEEQLRTKHFLSRFIIDRQDIWDIFDARGKAKVTYRLKALNYDDTFYRGDFPGFNGESIRSVLNTIARVGVIDENLMGSNNWHLDMGFVCLHEQWIAQMGLAINDPSYLGNYRKSLDYYRYNAISPDGNVKDRWAYRIWDSEPATFSNGFYECQWGDLLDSNTDYVINVAELFQMNGDMDWVKSHKVQCEKALAYLLRRDSDNDGLIEMLTDSHKENKGSDWIDVIWASYENAFVNAKLYTALIQWAEIEELSGDSSMAEYYRSAAFKCKNRFNQPISEGGFWNPENKWYVYWRDKDESIHGDNLVTPVNFMAIAYGICDDENRKKAILDKIESLMQKEKLFMWPISFFPYHPDEGYKVNYPFPNYENGDIFLAWGEVGIRAYQATDPSIAVKYIKNVLNQYEKDGLAFQRYGRKKQEGQGSDILANNCLSVVGLYRNIYGIQPQYNRLLLDPHITNELNGTIVKYWLRNQYYTIHLSVNEFSMRADSFSIISPESFGMNTGNNKLFYFNGKNPKPSLTVSCDKESEVKIKIAQWNDDKNGIRKWSVKTSSGKINTIFEIHLLKPDCKYTVLKDGIPVPAEKSDSNGILHITSKSESEKEVWFELREEE
jgi:hypothetical protein